MVQHTERSIINDTTILCVNFRLGAKPCVKSVPRRLLSMFELLFFVQILGEVLAHNGGWCLRYLWRIFNRWCHKNISLIFCVTKQDISQCAFDFCFILCCVICLSLFEFMDFDTNVKIIKIWHHSCQNY